MKKNSKEPSNKIALILLFAGLLCSLFLLKQEIDKQNTVQVSSTTVGNVSDAPEDMIIHVESFIENIKALPESEEHSRFIATAKAAIADNTLTPEAYNRIKLEHHSLQKAYNQNSSATKLTINQNPTSKSIEN